MINEEKVKLMTKIQIFKDTEPEAVRTNRYFRGDYIGLYLLRSLLAYVVMYLMALAVILLYKWEYILTTFDLDLFISQAQWIVSSFLILLIPVMVASYIIYWFRYRRCRKKIAAYVRNLKKLARMYDSEQ